jgi:hypothetical protein
MVTELLAEVPIAASLGRIGPIPAQVEVRRLSEFKAISGWSGSFGNVILDVDLLGISIIFTSSVLRPRHL